MMDYFALYGTITSMDQNQEIRIREGFPKQRLIVLPANVINRCKTLAMVRYLYVTDIGIYPCAPHHYVERKQGISQAILIYCLSGKGMMELNGTSYSIRQGNLIIIPPGIPHIYRADNYDPWSIFWIHFCGEQTKTLLENLGISNSSPSLYVPDTELMKNTFEEVYACLNYNYSDAGLLAMTSELMRLLSNIRLHQGYLELYRESAENRVRATIEFMHQHMSMKLTIEILAAHSGQSITYFSRLFKKRTNQSPMSYLIQLRIRKACELLDHTKLTVREISFEVGYDDPYYFSRLFKKVQGIPPITYRNTIKG